MDNAQNPNVRHRVITDCDDFTVASGFVTEDEARKWARENLTESWHIVSYKIATW